MVDQVMSMLRASPLKGDHGNARMAGCPDQAWCSKWHLVAEALLVLMHINEIGYAIPRHFCIFLHKRSMAARYVPENDTRKSVCPQFRLDLKDRITLLFLDRLLWKFPSLTHINQLRGQNPILKSQKLNCYSTTLFPSNCAIEGKCFS